MHTFGSLMYEFVMKNKLLLVAYIIVLVIIPLQDIGIPHIIGKLMEALRNKDENYQYIYLLAFLILVVQVGHSLNDFIEVKIYPTFQKFICTKILSYLFDKSSNNLQEIFIGKTLSIMAHAPRTMYNYLDVWRTDVFPQVVVFLVALIYISLVSWKLGIIVITVILIYYVIVVFTMTQCKEPSRVRESYIISLNEQVDDILMNAVGILNAGKKDQELKGIDRLYDVYQHYGELAMKCTMHYKFYLVPFMLLSVILFVMIGFTQVKNNKIKVEKLIVCIIIYLYVFNSIIRVINDVRDTAIRSGMVKEHLKIFESMKDPPVSSTPYTTQHRDKYIYFDNVNYSYGNKKVLDNFSLEIKKGEKLLIIGQIGSGKTTILKLLMRYSSPESGHLYLMGIPFEKISRSEIRQRIGYIPQNPILLNRTLYENIVYGSENVTKEQVMNIIKQLQLDSIFNESRLDQNVGKHGSKLSGGQRQVVWILRVLVQNPEVLIMDEPTSAIDKDTKSFIDRLFETVMKDRTTIVVSHDEYMSKLCDKTIKLG